MARSLSRERRYDPEKLDFAREMRRNQTQAEAVLWGFLRGSRLKGWKFRRQQLMYGYIADFYCEEGNLCVEIDGSVHQGSDQAAWDQARDFVSKAKGINVLRVSNDEVLGQKEAVLAKILEALGGPCPTRSGPRSKTDVAPPESQEA